MIDLICQAQRWFCHDPDETTVTSPWILSDERVMWEGRNPVEVNGVLI